MNISTISNTQEVGRKIHNVNQVKQITLSLIKIDCEYETELLHQKIYESTKIFSPYLLITIYISFFMQY